MSNIINITSVECLRKLKDNENTYLVDVRTPEEFKNDGFLTIFELFSEFWVF